MEKFSIDFLMNEFIEDLYIFNYPLTLGKVCFYRYIASSTFVYTQSLLAN